MKQQNKMHQCTRSCFLSIKLKITKIFATDKAARNFGDLSHELTIASMEFKSLFITAPTTQIVYYLDFTKLTSLTSTGHNFSVNDKN